MRKIEELARALETHPLAKATYESEEPEDRAEAREKIVRTVLEALRSPGFDVLDAIRGRLAYAAEALPAWRDGIDAILNEPEEPEEPAKPPRCEPPEGERKEGSYHWLSAADGALIIGRWTGGVWQRVGDGGFRSPEELHGYSWRWHSRILAPGEKPEPPPRRQPTIHELEEILKQPDTDVIVNEDGSIRAADPVVPTAASDPAPIAEYAWVEETVLNLTPPWEYVEAKAWPDWSGNFIPLAPGFVAHGGKRLIRRVVAARPQPEGAPPGRAR